tara:strand:+ start:407 stop:556 length:150 start_codon:yes stop_codon:yes gene_type:complete
MSFLWCLKILKSRTATARAQGMLRAISQPFQFKEKALYTGASIGVALFP